MSEDFESQLQRRMMASAQALPHKADRSQIVRTRGRRRRIATQAATSLFAVVCLVGVAGVLNLASNQSDNTTQVLGVPDTSGDQDTGGETGVDESVGSETETDGTDDKEPDTPPTSSDDVVTGGNPPAGSGETNDSTAPSEATTPSGDCLAAPPLADVSVTDPGKQIVEVSTEPQLQQAIATVGPNTVVLVAPGTYDLSATLVVRSDGVTIRGESTRCDEVVLTGQGMDNEVGAAKANGIWTDSAGLKVQNLTIRDVFGHGVQVNEAADAPQFYNLRLIDTGAAFIISNTAVEHGGGVSNGVVDYVTMAYTEMPSQIDRGGGVGLTNGVSILGGSGWVVKNSRFENFHNPDSADHLWGGAIQLSQGSADATVESNVFVNVDRAIIAGGLDTTPASNSGGVIRNNMIVVDSNLYSDFRKSSADATIILWDSPDTKVLHNTVITQGNTPMSIETRFDSDGAEVRNNLVDGGIRDRTGIDFVQENNINVDNLSIFADLESGDLRLRDPGRLIADAVPLLADAPTDIDGQPRSDPADAGADEVSG